MTRLQTQAKPASTTTDPAASGGRLLQRQCACGGSAGLTGECEGCQKEKLLGTNGVRLRKNPAISEPGDQYEREADQAAVQVTGGHVSCAADSRGGHAPQIQRQAAGPAATTDVSGLVRGGLSSEGRPLDSATQGFFEPRFGHDFSRVRVHTGARATRSTQMVGALAYTVGHDIVLGPGGYEPGTAAGRRLLAHELTHVVQQGRSGRVAAQTEPRVSHPGDAAEREADQVAHRVMAGLPSRVAETPSADVMCLDDGSLASEQPITLPTEELHILAPAEPYRYIRTGNVLLIVRKSWLLSMGFAPSDTRLEGPIIEDLLLGRGTTFINLGKSLGDQPEEIPIWSENTDAGRPASTSGSSLETAVKIKDWEEAANSLGLSTLASSRGSMALVEERPVRGRLKSFTDYLVPGKEARFRFEEERGESYRSPEHGGLVVPFVRIQWVVVPVGEGHTPVANTIRQHFLSINDMTFEHTFSEQGIYEVHAFVVDNYYLPAHFETQVEVLSEEEQLRRLEESSLEGWEVGRRTRKRRFDFAVYGEGVERGGILSQPALREDPTARNLAAVQDEIMQLNRFIEGAEPGDPQLELAKDRRKQLEATLASLEEISKSKRTVIRSRGSFVSRRSGVPSGNLKLVTSTVEGVAVSGPRVEVRILDHSGLLGVEDLEHVGEHRLGLISRLAEREYVALVKTAFEKLSANYPDGTISYSFETLDEGVPTGRFQQFERKTDTVYKDFRQIFFSQPVSAAVNIASLVLTAFPATAPAGIALGLAYNAGEQIDHLMAEQQRGTLSWDDGVKFVAQAGLDVLPIAGHSIKVAGSTGRLALALEGVSTMGTLLIVGWDTVDQVSLARASRVSELADLEWQLNELKSANPSHPQVRDLEQNIARLRAESRELMSDYLTQAAAGQFFWMAVGSVGGSMIRLSRDGAVEGPAVSERHGEGTRRVEGPSAEQAMTPAPGFRPGSTEVRPPAESPSPLLRPAQEDVRTGVEPAPELAIGLPRAMQAEIFVGRTQDNDASVKVMVEFGPFGVKRIHIEAGQLAQVQDIADHVRTVEFLQRYQGLSGAVRMLMEYAQGLLEGLPPSAVRRKIELQAEIDKLPAIIDRIKNDAKELEEKGKGLSQDDVEDFDRRIRDLEEQLAGHQAELAKLGPEARPAGFVAALDLIGPRNLSRDVTQGLNALRGDDQFRIRARNRQATVENILSGTTELMQFMSGGVGRVSNATQADIRNALLGIILDPLFGDLALQELRARVRPEFARETGSLTAQQAAERFARLVDGVNQQRLARNNDRQNLAANVIRGERARTRIPVGVGTVAAGTLDATAPGGAPQRLGPMIGTSPEARLPGEAPANPKRYWHIMSDKISLNPESEWADHAERDVLAQAGDLLDAMFPGIPREDITGELRLHVEKVPCTTCTAGLRPEHESRGPFYQFSKEFPGIRIIVSFDGPAAGNVPGNPFTVWGGRFK